MITISGTYCDYCETRDICERKCMEWETEPPSCFVREYLPMKSNPYHTELEKEKADA